MSFDPMKISTVPLTDAELNYSPEEWAEALAEDPSCIRAYLEAAEERGRRAEHDRARGVIHVLHQCIRGKCDCGPGQFACEETARTVIDSWDADRARKE